MPDELILKDLDELMQIETLLGPKDTGAPFGKNMRGALTWFLNKAESYGLKTGEADGYCGWAEMGEGKHCIGVLCHLDVVPAGEDWSCPPYKLTKRDGFLLGRGVVDNKGPAVIFLHVLKHLKESSYNFRNRIRLIAGLNEESGSECIAYYAKNCEIPKLSIVPDANFPVINSEKGILHLQVQLRPDDGFLDNVSFLEGGDRPNVIPGYAKAVFKNETVETRGTAGHAMSPEKADNALFKLLGRLKGMLKSETVNTVYKLFCSSDSKNQLGIDCQDSESGALTMSLGAAKLENEILKLTLDLRLPKCCDKDDVIKKITDKLPPSSRVTQLRFSPNLYLDPKSDLINTLLNVYTSVTGTRALPVQTGGGTYARELPSAAAFGPTFPDTENYIHNADERISLEHFNSLYDIYLKAVKELDKL